MGAMLGIAGFLRKTATIVNLEIRKLRNDSTELITRAVQPALWLLVFGEVFSQVRAIPTGNLRYIDFMAPGILAQSVLLHRDLLWHRDHLGAGPGNHSQTSCESNTQECPCVGQGALGRSERCGSSGHRVSPRLAAWSSIEFGSSRLDWSALDCPAWISAVFHLFSHHRMPGKNA